MSSEDWEEQMIERLVEMFRGMGMSLNKEQIKKLMRQFKSQFDNLGLDPEKIAKGDVNFNFDLSNMSKLFESGKSIEDILNNLGMDVQVDAQPIEINTPELIEQEDDVLKLPTDDYYLDGWNMAMTIDFTLKGEIKEQQIDMNLLNDGCLLEIVKDTQIKPVVKIELPHPCENVVGWSLNNGILDITLKLTPQGSAVNDDIPQSDVSIDLSDDDDDEDDGGIPML